MNNTKRKHVGMAGAILLLSLVAPATAFASSGEEITQVEPKPEIVEEVEVDAEDVSIDEVILVDGPLGPGYETVEEVVEEVQASSGPLGPIAVEVAVANEEVAEEVQQEASQSEDLASDTADMAYTADDTSVQESPSIEKAPYIPYKHVALSAFRRGT